MKTLTRSREVQEKCFLERIHKIENELCDREQEIYRYHSDHELVNISIYLSKLNNKQLGVNILYHLLAIIANHHHLLSTLNKNQLKILSPIGEI